MNPKLKALNDELSSLVAEGKSLANLDSLSDDQMKRAAELPGEINAKRAEIASLRELNDSVASADAFINDRRTPSIIREAAEMAASEADSPADAFNKANKLIARGAAPHLSMLMGNAEAAQRTAYRFGLSVAANVLGKRWAKDLCSKNGIRATMQENVNEDGGYLVPEEFESAIIVLRETYGVFRKYANIVPMGSDTKWQPRWTSGLTPYFVGEAATGTESKAGYDRVQLIAKKLMALAYVSSELDEDALVSLGDTLAGEIAYAFSLKEDNCGFNGDGTSTYGGMVGARQKLLDVFTTSGGTGLIVGSGNAYSELTLADFQNVQGALPEYAERNAAWFCSKKFWSAVLMKLALAAGGVPAAEIMMGGQRRFLGSPVVVSQVMPSTEANSQVPIVYGSLDMAAMLGNRRGVTIAESIHDRFSDDEIAFRGTQRFDINVHSVGATGTAGPIVGLVTASS